MSLVGFAVRGRNGTLGVVEAISAEPLGGRELIVSGGRSSLLRFHIPICCVTQRSDGARTVDVAVDVVDFVPQPASDGSIELHLTVQRKNALLHPKGGAA